MKKIFLAIITVVMLLSCEKVIDLELKDAESKFVVEGNITDQAGPYYVKLSRSVPFDHGNNYPAITDAEVVIEDSEGVVDLLTHTGQGIYKTNLIEGIEGRTYNLKIVADGETYTASSTMPNAVELDSISLTTLTFGTKKTILLIPGYTDPISTGNYYKFNLFINGEEEKTYMVSSDAANNGEVNERPLRNTDKTIEPNDEVVIEMESINEIDYSYFFTLSQMGFKGPTGGTTPTNPPTNISNGAIGLFSAHTVSKKSITIPAVVE